MGIMSVISSEHSFKVRLKSNQSFLVTLFSPMYSLKDRRILILLAW